MTIRLTKEQSEWLRQAAERAGVAQSRIVRDQLEKAMATSEGRFMSLAGTAKGPRDLSQRRGFSRS